ncbi:MAG: ABC transporter ATP-binding protein, partial [Oscillospiraceae bacterium]
MKDQKSAPPMKNHGPMGHGPNAVMQRGEKAKDFKGTIRKLIKYIGKYHLALIVVFLFAIASTVFAIIGPKVLGNATNEIFSGLMNQIAGTGEGIDFPKIAGTLLTLVAL